jgi:hypothetical protein
MNIFKGLLFLEGYLTTDEFAEAFDAGERYGSRAANARQFGIKAEPRREPAAAAIASDPAACGCA